MLPIPLLAGLALTAVVGKKLVKKNEVELSELKDMYKDICEDKKKNDMDGVKVKAERLQEHLSSIRQIAGWSAQELGEQLDLSRQAIYNLEKGAAKLSVAQYIAITTLLYQKSFFDDEGRDSVIPQILYSLVENPDKYSEEQLEKIKGTVELLAMAKSLKKSSVNSKVVANLQNDLPKDLEEKMEEYRKVLAENLRELIDEKEPVVEAEPVEEEPKKD